jgi:hypothetical protein
MFKAEYDVEGDKVASNAANSVKCNPVNTINQVTIDTDATAGNVTVLTKARLGKVLEPAFELDGVTPLVIDLSTGRRTFVIVAGIKEISTTAAGMDGTEYGLNSSGGDE